MRLLYLCQRIPYPPDRGDRIPVFHQIRRLGEEHEVVVGSLTHPGTRGNADALVKDVGIKIFAPDHSIYRRIIGMILALLQGKPLSLGYFRNPALQSWIMEEFAKRKFDAIIIFSSSMAQYVEHFRHIPRIMHFCDVDSQKWYSMAQGSNGFMRWIYKRENSTLLDYERKIAKEFPASCVVSQNEADLFKKHIPGVPVHIIENGVDVDYFAALPRKPLGLQIIFIGVMDYPPNVEAVSYFATNIWDRIRTVYPHARFVIVGAKPSRQVRNLEQIPGVEVTGYVPDVRPYLASASLSIAPLAIARGVQNKILEAMAAGLPILTTPGVAKGLPDGVASLVFTAEREAGPFASAVLDLIKNEAVREQSALKAQEFVRQHCTWEVKLQKLDDLLPQISRISQR